MLNSKSTAAADIQYQLAHLSDSRVSNIKISVAICLPASCLAVILRFVSRRIGKIPLKADDWCILVALVSFNFHDFFNGESK